LSRSGGTDRTDPILVGLLVLFAGLLFLVPGRYTVPFGAGVGLRPYQIVVLVAAVVLSRRFVRGTRMSLGLPAWTAGLLVLTAVVSIVANQDLDNETFLDSFRLTATTIFHVLIAVAVGVLATTPRRRRVIVGAVVTMVAVASLFAIHEAATSEPIRLEPTPPGLVEEKTLADQDYDGAPTIIRNGVPRPAGLSTNPLELSAVMALALPFAAYLLFSSRRWIGRVWFLACTVIIAVTVVLSISRTGFLAVGAMLLVALVANVRRPMRVVLGLTAVIALGATVATLVPASVDATMRQFEKDGTEDPSLATRLQDYEELDDLLGPSPWFGRGPNALESYVARDGNGIILDNQYLLQIAETGVIGLVGLLMLLMSAGAAAVGRIRGPTTERGLWVAAAGAVVGFAIMCATFDALRFAQATALLMVVVGLLSASDLGGEDQGLEASRVGAV
jgi:hypothetical protein